MQRQESFARAVVCFFWKTFLDPVDKGVGGWASPLSIWILRWEQKPVLFGAEPDVGAGGQESPAAEDRKGRFELLGPQRPHCPNGGRVPGWKWELEWSQKATFLLGLEAKDYNISLRFYNSYTFKTFLLW